MEEYYLWGTKNAILMYFCHMKLNRKYIDKKIVFINNVISWFLSCVWLMNILMQNLTYLVYLNMDVCEVEKRKKVEGIELCLFITVFTHTHRYKQSMVIQFSIIVVVAIAFFSILKVIRYHVIIIKLINEW